MKNSFPKYIDRLRAVTLDVKDLQKSVDFYTKLWGLEVVHQKGETVFLRATGTDHHVLVLSQAPQASLVSITFGTANKDDLFALYEHLVNNGVETEKPPRELPSAGGGWGFAFHDKEGRVFKVVADRTDYENSKPSNTFPVKLAHVVLNSINSNELAYFFTEIVGFRLSDKTKKMSFLRCNSDHHVIAICDANNTSLNHLAFEMKSWNELMFGVGRMKLAGYPVQWGVGRHGPGNNVFAYFIDPNGFSIEYTAEIEQIDETTHVIGKPDDWVRPPERMDQWGHSELPTLDMKNAMNGEYQFKKVAL